MYWYLVVYIVALVISIATMPKPQENPSGESKEFKIPTAEEGLEIPVLFGTRIISAPNIVWYGDVKATAIMTGGGKK